jgi:hypothetical protein
MKKLDARSLMGLAGALMVVGFFLPWIDAGGMFGVSGLDMVRAGWGWSFARIMLLMVPVAGAILVAAAAMKSPQTKRISLGIGLGFVGYGLFKLVQAFFALSGFGLWITIAAAMLAIGVPLLTPNRSAR